jgi:RNA ligase (TIGR02306 family)
MRKLATIRKIDSIRPIEGADAIECAVIGGWVVVVKRGEFKQGDPAIYIEVDSWVPHTLAPFLSKGKEPREYEGVKGEKLRTVRLRGQLSQGLLLPVKAISGYENIVAVEDTDGAYIPFAVGDDVTEVLGIKKWEPVIPAQLAGLVKGNFPSRIPKTDQERCQNLVAEIADVRDMGLAFEVTEKLEGSSMTVYLIDGEFGVCSRNLDLKRDEGNTFWKVALETGLEEKLRSLGKDIAFQGELIGPGIQKNIYGLTKHELHIFDVYDITAGAYLDPMSRRNLVEELGLRHVPLISPAFALVTVEELLDVADGTSKLANTRREGIVFKQNDGGMTFKAISNEYLIKQKD